MFPIINIGPIAIQAFGLILLLSFFIGTWLSRKFAQNLSTHVDAIENSLMLGLIAGILGARVGYMLKNPVVFIDNPLSLLSLTPSMLDVSFGILVGILSGFILAQKKHLPLWPTLDSLTPFFIFIFTGVHLANFANGNAFGTPTKLPWGVDLWNAIRHPLQLYALILAAALFIWLFMHTRQLKTTGFMRSGVLFNTILGGIGLITLITQAFSAQKLLLGDLNLDQVFAFAILIGSLGLIYTRAFSAPKSVSVLISLGSNLNPRTQLTKAMDRIASEFRIRRSSSLYLTEDVKGDSNTKPFLNQLIEIGTDLPFLEAVARLKAIEFEMGREPGNKKIVPLDLDILTYGDEVFSKAGKQIPAPDLIKYRYLALPLAEMSPNFRHPASGLSIQDILEQITDQSKVIKADEVKNGP